MFDKKIRAQATVILDEGFTDGMAYRTHGGETWAPREYVVEVRPADGPPFRTEVEAMVWMDWPQKGDIVSVEYNPKNHKTEMLIKGDPRYDPDVRRAADKDQMEAERRRALEGGPSGPDEVAQTSDSGQTGEDPELAELEKVEELERRDRAAGSSGAIDEHPATEPTSG